MDWVYQLDHELFKAINLGWHRPWLDPFFAFFSYTGLGLFPALVPFIFLVSKSTRHFVFPLILNVFVSGIILADGIKELTPRDRPSMLKIAIVEESIHTRSFPSGHTTTAFGFAMMLTLLTWNSRYRWAGVSSFIWAILVGLSRIYRGVHWPTDVLGGIGLGIGSACLIYLLIPKLPFSKPLSKATGS